MAKIKKNDKVIVIAGKDKGKNGIVQAVSGDRVVIEGVNMITKHQKGNPQKGEQPGIVQREKSVHISNVAIFNTETNKKDKVKFSIDDNGKKTRIFGSNKQAIDL